MAQKRLLLFITLLIVIMFMAVGFAIEVYAKPFEYNADKAFNTARELKAAPVNYDVARDVINQASGVAADKKTASQIEDGALAADKKTAQGIKDHSLAPDLKTAREIKAGSDKLLKNIGLPKESGLYIFISTSMHDKKIREYAEDAKKYGAVLVLRGLKHNSFQKTIAYFEKLNAEIQIDPNLFKKYQVRSVPQIVLAKGDKYDIIKGSVSLEFALRKFALEGDVND